MTRNRNRRNRAGDLGRGIERAGGGIGNPRVSRGPRGPLIGPFQPVHPLLFALARKFARCNIFHPDLYPLPLAFQAARLTSLTARTHVEELTFGVLSRDCDYLDAYIQNVLGVRSGLDGVNPRGRCDTVFYHNGRCRCTGGLPDCRDRLVAADGLPLVVGQDGSLNPGYSPEVRGLFERHLALGSNLLLFQAATRRSHDN